MDPVEWPQNMPPRLLPILVSSGGQQHYSAHFVKMYRQVQQILRAALGLAIFASFSQKAHPFVPHATTTTARRRPDPPATSTLRATVASTPSSASSTTDTDFDDVTIPRGAKNDWEVHKFGGASLATADLYRTVGDLLITEAEGRGDAPIPTMAIVSARGGMTDLLVKVVDSALVDFEQANVALEEAVESAISLLKELAPSEITDPIEARFRSDGQDILSVVQSLRMLNTVPAVTMEVVTGKCSGTKQAIFVSNFLSSNHFLLSIPKFRVW